MKKFTSLLNVGACTKYTSLESTMDPLLFVPGLLGEDLVYITTYTTFDDVILGVALLTGNTLQDKNNGNILTFFINKAISNTLSREVGAKCFF